MQTLLRRHIAILTAIILLLTAGGCSDGLDGPDPSEGDCMLIDVRVPLDATRATADELNEYHVERLHLYFFKADGHDDAASEYVYDIALDETFDFSRQLRLEMPDDALASDGLFGTTASTCIVYAAANVEESRLTGKTVDALKATAVESRFDVTQVQESFAMDGTALLTLDRATRLVSGTITLQRAAAKLSLSLDVPESIETEETIFNPVDGTTTTEKRTYIPATDDMRVWISNGVKRSHLNAAPEPPAESDLYSNRISAATGVGSPFGFDATQPKYKYVQDIPFYSYPSQWDEYSPHGNCFLTLEIPWSYRDKTGATHNLVTYYRLSVQPGKSRLERNVFYDMRVTIGRLGGTTVEEPVDMLAEWNYNMEWNRQTLPTDIKEIRYLLLNNNDWSETADAYAYTMDNETEISIPYNSSHPVEIESVELSWHDFLYNRDRKLTLTTNGSYTYSSFNGYNQSRNYAGLEIDETNSTLKLKRELLHIAYSGTNGRPSISGDDAINPYTFTIKIRHKDAVANDPSAHATIVVTQIPAIFINALQTMSGDTRFVNNNYSTKSDTYGYVSSNARNNDLYLGSTASNPNNPRTYILTISKFAIDDNYIIADPRKRTIDNLNSSGASASSTATWSRSDNNKRLTNYYPADDDASKQRFIAPQIRIASQWGATQTVTYKGAQRRCASYQENGRPAGRWRLPSVAEIEFISRLSNKKFIPYLFGDDGDYGINSIEYWCGTGAVRVNNDPYNPTVTTVANPTGRRYVRCVYDEWFWGTDTLTNKTRFTWGDRARSINGN